VIISGDESTPTIVGVKLDILRESKKFELADPPIPVNKIFMFSIYSKQMALCKTHHKIPQYIEIRNKCTLTMNSVVLRLSQD